MSSLSRAFRKVYDATSDSRSSFGKIGRWMYPFNAQYVIRDAWRKYGKPLMQASGTAYRGPSSASSIGNLGNTGFRRYV